MVILQATLDFKMFAVSPSILEDISRFVVTNLIPINILNTADTETSAERFQLTLKTSLPLT